MTEIPIITKDETPKRPDRVLLHGKNAIVIDFKTGLEKPVDKKQILEYKQLLNEMGYQNAEAYLLYIALNKVIKVV
jgi:CRISPR/Cas system-associated exonuclease Cas4 (RecB family)